MDKNNVKNVLMTALMSLLIVILFSPLNLYADKSINDSDCNVLLWDLSGTYDDYSIFYCDSSFTLIQDEQGKLSGGSGLRSCEIYHPDVGYIDAVFFYTIKGSVKQKNGITSIKMTITNTGDAQVNGSDYYPFKATQKMTAEVNPSNSRVEGSVKVKACLKGIGCDSTGSLPFSISIPVVMDGTWDLNFEENGMGTLVLSNGRSIDFRSEEKYNLKKGVGSYKLENNNKGKINLKYGSGSLISIKGKVLGQNIKFKAP